LRAAPVLTFRTANSASAGRLGDALAPRGTEPLPLLFSDGTRVAVGPAARARVVATRVHGADIVLEQGSLNLAVVHAPDSDWHVSAGPFTVNVTGTTFDVGWAPRERTFTLALHEGAVRVLGPTLGSAGRWLERGATLRIVMDEVGESIGAALPSESAAPSSPPGPPSSAAEPLPTKVGGAEPKAAWRELSRKARYADALAAAEAEGFEGVAKSASATDLVLLGNTARFAGSSARAEQAFRLVRSRFGRTHEAAMAAFFLGRIAYDQKGDRRAAAEWFQSYLREEPNGGLAREAAGRLVEAEKAAGDLPAARAAAHSYLEKYPSGPHAGLARGVLGQ
jgi:TolA-binding protein